jgi:hypothetical protein
MYQKGGVGIPVIIAVVGGVLVLMVGYSFVGNMSAQDIPDAPSIMPVAASEDEPERTQSLVSFDDNFYRSGDDFFIRLAAGFDADGKQTYTYIKVDIADAATFRKVPVVGGGAGIGDGVKGKTMPGFYIDSKQVYFFSGTSVTVVQGADPNSFQVLSPTYAKDNNNVYYVTTSCDQSGNCTGVLTVIPGADPETFETHHETEVPDPTDPDETVTVDARDDDNIYYQGIWVGPLPDPDDHSIHPDVDNPVLISP